MGVPVDLVDPAVTEAVLLLAGRGSNQTGHSSGACSKGRADRYREQGPDDLDDRPR